MKNEHGTMHKTYFLGSKRSYGTFLLQSQTTEQPVLTQVYMKVVKEAYCDNSALPTDLLQCEYTRPDQGESSNILLKHEHITDELWHA